MGRMNTTLYKATRQNFTAWAWKAQLEEGGDWFWSNKDQDNGTFNQTHVTHHMKADWWETKEAAQRHVAQSAVDWHRIKIMKYDAHQKRVWCVNDDYDPSSTGGYAGSSTKSMMAIAADMIRGQIAEKHGVSPDDINLDVSYEVNVKHEGTLDI